MTRKKDKWELSINGKRYKAHSTTTKEYFEYTAEPMTLEKLKSKYTAEKFASFSQDQIDSFLKQYVVVMYFVTSEFPKRTSQIESMHKTEAAADKEARRMALADVDQHNYVRPKLKGSFDRNGDPKECRECGQEGEDCECWKENE